MVAQVGSTASAQRIPSSPLASRLDGIWEQLRREKGKAAVMAICIAALGYFVIYPFGALLLRGVVDPKTGAFTLARYIALVNDEEFRSALLTSLTISFGCLIVSMCLALPMAWAVSRTDMPLKGFVRTMTVLTFATPSFLGAIAWVVLLGPRGGSINLAIQSLFGLESTPFSVFSVGGLIFVFSLYLYPYIFFAATTALDNMDPAMEEAAGMLGAGTWWTSVSITLPLILPAVLAGGALVVLESMVNFGVPAILGLPVHIETLTTRIYSLFQFPPNYEAAATTAMPIVLIVLLCVFAQRLAVGRRTYVTVGGISSQRRVISLGGWRWVFAGLSLLIISASIFVPFTALLIISVKKTFGNPISFENMSLIHYMNIAFGSSTTQRAIVNSVMLAAGAALICMAFAVVLAWLVERTKLPGRGLLGALVMACFSLPGIALAVSLIFAFSRGSLLPLYGTIWIILLAYVIHGLPVVFNYTRNSLRQVNAELSDAAEIAGASPARALWDITVPLIRGGVISGGLIVFVLMVREFGSSVLLTSAGTEVVAVAIYEFAEEGDNGRMAALAIIIYLINLAVVLPARRLAKSVRGSEL